MSMNLEQYKSKGEMHYKTLKICNKDINYKAS